MHKQNKVQLVIDGVTGVGKSSLVEIMAQELELTPFQEIFEDKNQLLHKFFHDRHKWALPMQINFLNNRFRQFKAATELNNAIMDRSIFSDRIFAVMYRDMGYLTPEEFDVYEELLASMMEHVEPPQLVVFLDVSTQEAIRRIIKRGRPDEVEVEAAYWESLNTYYQDNYRLYKFGNLITINVDGIDFVNNPQDRRLVVETIKQAWLKKEKS